MLQYAEELVATRPVPATSGERASPVLAHLQVSVHREIEKKAENERRESTRQPMTRREKPFDLD